MATSPQNQPRSLATLRNLTADNGHTYYTAPPGYSISAVLVAGVAQSITIPTDGNGNKYRAVAFSYGGNLYYTNIFTTATGVTGTPVTNGYADQESPPSLVLQNGDATTLNGVDPGAYVTTTFSVISATAGTLWMRFFN